MKANTKVEEEAAREWGVLCEVLQIEDVGEAERAMDVRMSDTGVMAVTGVSVGLIRTATQEKHEKLLGMLKRFYIAAYVGMNRST